MRKFLFAVLLALVALAGVGCSKDGDRLTNPDNETTQEARFEIQLTGADNSGATWGLPGINIEINNGAEIPFTMTTGPDGSTLLKVADFPKTSFFVNSIGKQALKVQDVYIRPQCSNPGGGVGGLLCFAGFRGDMELEVRNNGSSQLEYFWATQQLVRQ